MLCQKFLIESWRECVPGKAYVFWKAFVTLLKLQKPVLFQGPFSEMNSRQGQQYSLLFDIDPVSHSILSNDAIKPPLQGCVVLLHGVGLPRSIILCFSANDSVENDFRINDVTISPTADSAIVN